MKNFHIALIYHQQITLERILDEKHQKTISLGSKDSNLITIDNPYLGENFDLLVYQNNTWKISLPPKVEATLELSGAELEFCAGDSVETREFSPNDWAILAIGDNLDLIISYEEKSPKIAAQSPIARLSHFFKSPLALMLYFSLILHLGLIFLAFWFSHAKETKEWSPLESRWVELVTTLEEHKEKDDPPQPTPVIEDPDDIIVDDSVVRQNREKIDDKKSDFANLGKLDKQVGLQAALGRSKVASAGMESLFGSAVGLGNATDQMAITADGDAYGTGIGFGAGIGSMRGGGGGGGFGGAGLGSLGSGGKLDSTKIAAPSKAKAKIKPKLELATAEASQFCKEANIREVVGKRANALRNCYEQQLLADPQLSGKIILLWKIGLDGEVMQASTKSTTLNNEKVESCLEKTVRRLRFDKPDGGICVVEFPFIFSSSQ